MRDWTTTRPVNLRRLSRQFAGPTQASCPHTPCLSNVSREVLGSRRRFARTALNLTLLAAGQRDVTEPSTSDVPRCIGRSGLQTEKSMFDTV